MNEYNGTNIETLIGNNLTNNNLNNDEGNLNQEIKNEKDNNFENNQNNPFSIFNASIINNDNVPPPALYNNPKRNNLEKKNILNNEINKSDSKKEFDNINSIYPQMILTNGDNNNNLNTPDDVNVQNLDINNENINKNEFEIKKIISIIKIMN